MELYENKDDDAPHSLMNENLGGEDSSKKRKRKADQHILKYPYSSCLKGLFMGPQPCQDELFPCSTLLQSMTDDAKNNVYFESPLDQKKVDNPTDDSLINIIRSICEPFSYDGSKTTNSRPKTLFDLTYSYKLLHYILISKIDNYNEDSKQKCFPNFKSVPSDLLDDFPPEELIYSNLLKLLSLVVGNDDSETLLDEINLQNSNLASLINNLKSCLLSKRIKENFDECLRESVADNKHFSRSKFDRNSDPSKNDLSSSRLLQHFLLKSNESSEANVSKENQEPKYNPEHSKFLFSCGNSFPNSSSNNESMDLSSRNFLLYSYLTNNKSFQNMNVNNNNVNHSMKSNSKKTDLVNSSTILRNLLVNEHLDNCSPKVFGAFGSKMIEMYISSLLKSAAEEDCVKKSSPSNIKLEDRENFQCFLCNTLFLSDQDLSHHYSSLHMIES